MNQEREGGMLLIAVIAWAIVMMMCVVMCGCSGKKVVTESVYVHDTLVVVRKDTISIDRWNWRHDTIRVETEKIVTLLQQDKNIPAETIRIETNNWHWQHEIIRDSSAKVVARVDSILKALDRQHEKQTTKTKTPLNQYLIFLLIVGGVIIGVWIWRK